MAYNGIQLSLLKRGEVGREENLDCGDKGGLEDLHGFDPGALNETNAAYRYVRGLNEGVLGAISPHDRLFTLQSFAENQHVVVVTDMQPLGVLDGIINSKTEVSSDLDRVRIEGGLVQEGEVGRGDDEIAILHGSNGIQSSDWGI